MLKKLVLLLAALLCLTACGKTEPAPTTEPATQPTEPEIVEVEALLSEEGGYLEYQYSGHVLNEKGQVISRKVTGDSRRTDTFEYDDQGRVIKETRTSSYSQEIWTYTYDENGRLVEEFQGDRTFANTYTLDEQGRVLTMTSVNTDPQSDYQLVYSYTYNDDGTVATETQKSERSTYVITFTYDHKGRVSTARSVKEGENGGVTTYYTYGVVGTYVPEN